MRIAALFVAFVLSIGVAFGDPISAGQKWVNTGGSEFAVTSVGANGAVVGSYVNKKSGFACQNEPMEVTGWVFDPFITFAVRWKNANVDCNSLTSWVGYFAFGKLYTEWDLIYISSETGLPTHLRDRDVFSLQ